VNVVERLKLGFELFNRGEFDQAVELLAEDVCWRARLGAVEGHGALTGRTEVAKAWREQSDALGGVGVFRLELLEIEQLGGGVILVRQRLSGRGAISGADVSDDFVTVWTFRGGQPIRVDSYDDRAAALADLATD
jgi:ketosteroid isomerase-like protein